MADTDLLSCREIRNFPGRKVRLAAHRDDLYLYVDETESLRTFDSSSLSSKTLPPADKTIRGQAVALDFSPSHQLAVVAYSDGGLVAFSLEDWKPLRVLTKPHGSCASAVAFRDDSSFFVGEGAVLWLWRISRSLNFRPFSVLPTQEAEIFRFDAPISGIFVPRVFSFISPPAKGGSHCLAPRFAESVGVSTAESFAFGWVSGSGPFTPSVEVNCVLPACAFDRADPSLLRFAVCAGTDLSVYSVSETRVVSVISTVSVPQPCAHLCFLGGSVILGLGTDLRGFVVAGGSAVVPNVVCPGSGVFIGGQHSFRLGSEVLLDISLETFGGRMERLREAPDGAGFEKAVSLCRRVIANDAVATIGLPGNASQRALMIERELADLLEGESERRLGLVTDDKSAGEVASWLISLNRELGMEEWLVGEGASIFKAHGRLPALLQQLVSADPDATAFCYTAEFGALLLEHADCDIRSFVLRLPRDIVPLEDLLRFGQRRCDEMLLSELLLSRGDLASGLSVLANAGRTREVCLLLLSRVEGADDEMEMAIGWLFARSGGRFPRAEQLLAGPTSESTELFSAVQQFIERTGRPFGLERFVEAISVVLSERSTGDELGRRLDETVLNRRVKVSGTCASRLARRIFGPATAGADRREELLLHLLNCDLPKEFGEALLLLCDSFGFRKAKRHIQLASEKYESVIQELAADPSSDVFEFARELLDRSGSAARSAILRSASILCARDGIKFASFLRNHMSDCLGEAISAVQEGGLRHRVVHELLRSGLVPPLDRATEASFFGFLCEFFPDEARGFAESRERDLEHFLGPAEEFQIFDCCAVVHARVGAVNRVCESFSLFIEERLTAFAEGDENGASAVEKFAVEFARGFLRGHNGQDGLRFAESAVRAFALPLFALWEKKCNRDQCKQVIDLLCQIVSLALNAIPFADLLRLFIIEFQELPFVYARACLLSVLNDYEYDLDQNLSMVLLYHEDEQNAHTKYMRNLIGGTECNSLQCCSCKRSLFGVSCPIQVFECGHVFHQTDECLPKAVCPVCNPEECLGQDIQAPIHTIPRNRFRRDLTRFENVLARKGDAPSSNPESLADIYLPRRNVFPL